MHHFYSLLLLLFCFKATSQEKPYTSKLTTATILSPGISYEQPVGNKWSVKGRLAYVSNWTFSSSLALGESFSFSPGPLAGAQLRYYYNFQQRERKQKMTDRNSANYFSLLAKYVYFSKTHYYTSNGNYTVSSPSNSPNFGIVWGIQRNYKNRFSIDCSVGPSLYTPFANNEFTLIGDVSLGLWLGKKSN